MGQPKSANIETRSRVHAPEAHHPRWKRTIPGEHRCQWKDGFDFNASELAWVSRCTWAPGWTTLWGSFGKPTEVEIKRSYEVSLRWIECIARAIDRSHKYWDWAQKQLPITSPISSIRPCMRIEQQQQLLLFIIAWLNFSPATLFWLGVGTPCRQGASRAASSLAVFFRCTPLSTN